MAKKLTYEFVKGYIESFGYKLLSLEYNGNKKPLELECSNGHKFSMRYDNFKQGQRCPHCYGNVKYTYEFVKEYIESFGYKLSSKEYEGNKKELDIICPNGNLFKMSYSKFQQGHRCRCEMCYDKGKARRNDFAEVKKHIESFGYKLLTDKYKNNREKLRMICPKGHLCEIDYDNFQRGRRCSHCNMSRGEISISENLNILNVEYTSQYKFDDCRGKKLCLPFDFYLPQYNCCIEFDGEQHYLLERFNIGLIDLMNRKYLDNIKTEYCKRNNLKLIRIPYWEFNNIKRILTDELKL